VTAVTAPKVLYTGRAHTVGGRDGGSSRTDDGRLDLHFTSPGKAGNGTNPEQLFAAGWSACFIGAMGVAAARRRIQLPSDTAVDIEIDLRQGDGAYSLGARFNVSLPGLDRAVAQEVMEAAHQICPYSNATRGNIDVAFTLA
jgi:lipoyl-dependent peroxiredoxin